MGTEEHFDSSDGRDAPQKAEATAAEKDWSVMGSEISSEVNEAKLKKAAIEIRGARTANHRDTGS